MNPPVWRSLVRTCENILQVYNDDKSGIIFKDYLVQWSYFNAILYKSIFSYDGFHQRQFMQIGIASNN